MAKSAETNTSDVKPSDGDESADLKLMNSLTAVQTERHDRARMRAQQRGNDQRFQEVEDSLARKKTDRDSDGAKVARAMTDDMDNSLNYKTGVSNEVLSKMLDAVKPAPQVPGNTSHLFPQQPKPNGLSTIAKTLVAAGIGAGILGTGAGGMALGYMLNKAAPAVTQPVDTDTQAIYEGSGQ